MSAKREKKKRYNQKLELIQKFERWAIEEPPIWMFWRWKKWLSRRPEWWPEIELEEQLPF